MLHRGEFAAMSSASSDFNLRLVGLNQGADGEVWRQTQNAKLAIMKENRLAAHAIGLDPTDPRLVLAAQAKARLQGAMLSPERRTQLLKTGRKLGMRPFESSLVIAVVQDQARSSVEPGRIHQVEDQTVAVSDPESVTWPRWFAAVAAAMAIAGLLIRWLATI